MQLHGCTLASKRGGELIWDVFHGSFAVILLVVAVVAVVVCCTETVPSCFSSFLPSLPPSLLPSVLPSSKNQGEKTTEKKTTQWEKKWISCRFGLGFDSKLQKCTAFRVSQHEQHQSICSFLSGLLIIVTFFSHPALALFLQTLNVDPALRSLDPLPM